AYTPGIDREQSVAAETVHFRSKCIVQRAAMQRSEAIERHPFAHETQPQHHGLAHAHRRCNFLSKVLDAVASTHPLIIGRYRFSVSPAPLHPDAILLHAKMAVRSRPDTQIVVV